MIKNLFLSKNKSKLLLENWAKLISTANDIFDVTICCTFHLHGTKLQLFCNSVSDSRLPIENYIHAQIWNNGEVQWYYPAIFQSSCVVNVKYFPFDQQACPLDFGSWTYDSHKVMTLDINKLNSEALCATKCEHNESYLVQSTFVV